jgi:hypothetical protein
MSSCHNIDKQNKKWIRQSDKYEEYKNAKVYRRQRQWRRTPSNDNTLMAFVEKWANKC